MKKTFLIIIIILFILIGSRLYPQSTYLIREQVVIGNLSLTVLDVKTDNIIVQPTIIATEFPGGVYFSESKDFETLKAMPGNKFFLINLEMKNLGGDTLHLMGKEYKILNNKNNEVFYPGVISRKSQKATDTEIKLHYYPYLITLQTLVSDQSIDGWIVFEIAETIEPTEFRWYDEFQSQEPLFIVKLQ